MEKLYSLNSMAFYDTYDNLYKKIGKTLEIDYNTLTMENLNKLMKVLTDIILNPIEIEDKVERRKGNISCLDDESNQIFNNLFNDPHIKVYGHGTFSAKEIFDSGIFKCEYPNLSSHFLMLDNNDESISKVKKWPHKNSSQVLILAIDDREYYPIYKEENSITINMRSEHSMPIEYFVGYYDAEHKQFIKNDKFKIEHKYNPEYTLRGDEEFHSVLACSYDKNVSEFVKIIEKIHNILLKLAKRKINLNTLKYIQVELTNHMKRLYELQSLFTKEYLSKAEQSYNEHIKLGSEPVVFDDEVGGTWEESWLLEDDSDISKKGL